MTRTVTAHGRTFEVETHDPPPSIRKPHGRRRRFTQIPRLWEETLGRARASGSTYAVSLVLLYEAAMSKRNGHEPVVKLSDALLKPVGVGRQGKQAALRKLGDLKLVEVQQAPGRNPIVTVHFLD